MLSRHASLVVAMTLLVLLLTFYDQVSIKPISQAFTTIRTSAVKLGDNGRGDFGEAKETKEQQGGETIDKSEAMEIESGEKNAEDPIQQLEKSENVEAPEEPPAEVFPEDGISSKTESSSVTNTEDNEPIDNNDNESFESDEKDVSEVIQNLEQKETVETSSEASPEDAIPTSIEQPSSASDSEDENSLGQQIEDPIASSDTESTESGATNSDSLIQIPEESHDVDTPEESKTDVARDSASSEQSESVGENSGLAFPADSSCFVPDYSRAEALLRMNNTLPKPILNLGMPKCGSSTLTEFFSCAGMKSSHWKTDRSGYIGACMRDAIQNGEPPIASCDTWFVHGDKSKEPPDSTIDRGAEAILQMDVENNPDQCVFPQMSYLHELHDEAPNATFILNFRDVLDWVSSVSRWSKNGELMSDRLAACDLPGLPVGKGTSTVDLSAWLCGHVNNVRKFVEEHPSHALIELDLYNTEKNAEIMSQLFKTKKSCWVHANANPGRLRGLRAKGVADDDELSFQIWS